MKITIDFEFCPYFKKTSFKVARKLGPGIKRCLNYNGIDETLNEEVEFEHYSKSNFGIIPFLALNATHYLKGLGK